VDDDVRQAARFRWTDCASPPSRAPTRATGVTSRRIYWPPNRPKAIAGQKLATKKGAEERVQTNRRPPFPKAYSLHGRSPHRRTTGMESRGYVVMVRDPGRQHAALNRPPLGGVGVSSSVFARQCTESRSRRSIHRVASELSATAAVHLPAIWVFAHQPPSAAVIVPDVCTDQATPRLRAVGSTAATCSSGVRGRMLGSTHLRLEECAS